MNDTMIIYYNFLSIGGVGENLKNCILDDYRE